MYLTSERKLSRKIKEAVLADRLERQYTKDQILQAYLNTIYLGNGAYGVEAAANVYFNEHASQLTLPQAALLAGLIQNPSGYDPILAPAAARTRRAEVLARMVHYGDITQAQADAANGCRCPRRSSSRPVAGDQISDYYVQEVETELLGPSSPLGGTYDQRYQALFEGGLKIYTNLDPTCRRLAEQTIAARHPRQQPGLPGGHGHHRPATGNVLAMVGGPGFSTSHFDIVTQGTRQPGSGFKLFTLLAALQQGYSIYDTVDGAVPVRHRLSRSTTTWSRHPANNDEGNGGGVVTLLNATAQSINCAYIRLAHEVGLPNVISMAHSSGISETLPAVPVDRDRLDRRAPDRDGRGLRRRRRRRGVPRPVVHQPHRRPLRRRPSTTATAPGHRVVSTQIADGGDRRPAGRGPVRHRNSGADSTTARSPARPARPAATSTPGSTASPRRWRPRCGWATCNAEVPMVDVGGYGAVYGGDFPTATWHDFVAAVLGRPAGRRFPAAQQRPAAAEQVHHLAVAGGRRRLDHNGGYYVLLRQQPARYGYTQPTYSYTPPTDTPPTPAFSPLPTTKTPPSTTPVTAPATPSPGTNRGRGGGATTPDERSRARVAACRSGPRHWHRSASPPRSPPPGAGRLAALDAEAGRAGSELRKVTGERDEIAGRQTASRGGAGGTEQRAAAVNGASTAGGLGIAGASGHGRRLETLEARASDLEDAVLEPCSRSASPSMPSRRLADQLEAVEERRRSVGARLDDAAARWPQRSPTLTSDREAAAAGVPADLLGTYERLRARLEGSGQPGWSATTATAAT